MIQRLFRYVNTCQHMNMFSQHFLHCCSAVLLPIIAIFKTFSYIIFSYIILVLIIWALDQNCKTQLNFAHFGGKYFTFSRVDILKGTREERCQSEVVAFSSQFGHHRKQDSQPSFLNWEPKQIFWLQVINSLVFSLNQGRRQCRKASVFVS